MSTVDLTMIRGMTATMALDIDNLDGTPFDLTGYTVTVAAKREKDQPDSEAIFRLAATVTNAVAGLASCTIPASATRGVPADATLYYDVTAKSGSGAIQKPIIGKLTVTGDVGHVPI